MAKALGLEGLVAGELRRAIAADGRSIDAVGQGAGFSRGYLSQLLRGRQDLKLQHVERVLAVLGIEPDHFLRRVQESLWESRTASAGRTFERDMPHGLPDAHALVGAERESRGWSRATPAAEAVTGRMELQRTIREIVREEFARLPLVEGQRAEEGAARPVTSARYEEAEGQDQEATALERLREILALPEGDRAESVRRQPERYSGTELSRLLLDEARGHLPAEARQAYALAGLALAVLRHSEPTAEATELFALAMAHQGNALRAQSELPPAEELLESARFLLDAHGSGSALARAELDSLEGSLRSDQSRFDEAESLLSRAVAVQVAEERPVEAARVLLKLGTVHGQTGDPDRAIESYEKASEIFAEHGETKLLLMARHNLARYYMDTGDVDRSRAILTESQELYEQFPWAQIRRLWLEGHLARAAGDVEAAEDAYRAVRDGFLEQGVGYDAALAALDLAFLYAERGRTAELKRVAEEIVPVFEAQDVHREAAAALMLFQKAVRAERATLGFLGELSRYLERARGDPELRFRPPPE